MLLNYKTIPSLTWLWQLRFKVMVNQLLPYTIDRDTYLHLAELELLLIHMFQQLIHRVLKTIDE